ncbi:PREDICTED: protein PHLOEM PROTEIN 2-LIKE A8-like [Tarenaya hassleriana]|uniref:protein PHLOEM PROTEIN 2-LIKE A8-like n=1 Tax=Tarenaya hassleriana TaxID=28532 RepID=UPI00053C9A3E|nr:PREDICTED: protein PHLOEM PROTEIN 2-LIKE A8-like [Tarenaya hassleriana]XP_010544103.1 PREDICTED: protein PHLOEM PROTEIN 2-LIKE A8-like [Tarenaya hassleriana]XP_010544105.1 PREDICTED: protein PHLOEM PROTEIN 2-LIKE A8-like [Tarenaya hassleriana]XP_010544106.1 PREDICTED: protein PHLOEM PROTEIN 2-LIKE A8-like [Tarenaya hassleriana]
MGIFSRHLTVPPPQQHEVFINYRGGELRYGFISHLVDAFHRHRIRFSVDNGERRGEDLKNLFVRIQESRIALAVFSTRYPDSEWCLDELVKIDECVKMGNLRVIPIFYKVEPDDVRRQEGGFGENFWKLAKISRGKQIMMWKDALESVSDKMGLTFDDKSYESEFIKEIVTEVERVLTAIPSGQKGYRSYNHMRKERRNAPYALYQSRHWRRTKSRTFW